MDKNSLEFKKARSRLYTIFSVFFCQPEVDIHGNSALYDSLSENLARIYTGQNYEVPQLKAPFNTFTDNSLLVEYTRLFIGPFKTLASPYSSVYLDSNGAIFGQETQWVIEFYKNSGLEVAQSFNELPDHIAIELEFLHYLSSYEINEIESGNTEKAEALFNLHEIFLNKHLKQWTPMFCDRIISETNNDYYRTLAICFKSFVESKSDQS